MMMAPLSLRPYPTGGEAVLSPLIAHLTPLTNSFGVSYRRGGESDFVSSLRYRGLPAQELRVLQNIIEGRGVKLHDYLGLKMGLIRLQYNQVAAKVLKENLEEARARFLRIHDRAIHELHERRLLDPFVRFAIDLHPIMIRMGLYPVADVWDASYEFRRFVVEEESLLELFDLANRYFLAGIQLRDAAIVMNTFLQCRQ